MDVLASWKGESLYLDGLQSLSAKDAEALLKFPKLDFDLSLKGLKSLSLETAKVLEKIGVQSLSLNGLTTLPLDVAKVLTSSGCSLTLNGLTYLTRRCRGSSRGQMAVAEWSDHLTFGCCPSVGKK